MKTTLGNGDPMGFDDLINTFWRQIIMQSDLAEFAVQGSRNDVLRQALAQAISSLRDDWEIFVEALRALPDTELVSDPESERVLRERAAGFHNAIGSREWSNEVYEQLQLEHYASGDLERLRSDIDAVLESRSITNPEGAS